RGKLCMGRRQKESAIFNRREFLGRLGYASPALLPAPFRAYWPFPSAFSLGDPDLSEVRLKPSYPSPSPLDPMLRLLTPRPDAYLAERHAASLGRQLEAVGNGIQRKPSNPENIARWLDDSFRGRGPREFAEERAGSASGIEMRRRKYGDRAGGGALLGRDAFLA